MTADARRHLLLSLKADMWDEGYAAAEHMARSWGHTDWWEDEPSNPYRDELEVDK